MMCANLLWPRHEEMEAIIERLGFFDLQAYNQADPSKDYKARYLMDCKRAHHSANGNGAVTNYPEGIPLGTISN